MIRKIVAVWVSLAMLFGFVVIVDVVTDITPTVRATTLYVNTTGLGGAYTSIQDAINASSDGDTVFVYNGTYYENVVVNKTINLIGEDRTNTIINASEGGTVVLIEVDWVNITGFNVTGNGINYAGIYPYKSDNITIANNTVFDVNNGIYLAYSDNNIIVNNRLFWNSRGIYLFHSHDNTITNNIISNGDDGIHMMDSDNNTITNNIATSNIKQCLFLWRSDWTYIANNTLSFNNQGIYFDESIHNTIFNNTMVEDGIFLEGNSLNYWNTHTIDTSNTVNGNPVHYWKNQNSGTIPPGAGEVILANCTNITIENQNLSNGDNSIELGFSDYITITNNTASSNDNYGIFLYYSDNNTIANNNFSNNHDGIFLYASDTNTLANNDASFNEVDGIYLEFCRNNTCNNNNASWNFRYGMGFHYGSGNLIANNTASNTIWTCGIRIFGSHFNTVTNNTLISNGGDGIQITQSDGNTITYNTAFGNTADGIDLYHTNDHTILSNNISSNSNGIEVSDSTDITIIYNNITSNNRYGIWSDTCIDSAIAYNNISLNNWSGISFYADCDNNIIAYNTIAFNLKYGIRVYYTSHNNRIFHNNIIGNSNQSYDRDFNINQWDNGYPLGGNYWSDYSGNDSYKGPNQEVPGSDEIGDTPYINIHGGSGAMDNYPLMKPYEPIQNYTILKPGWNLISLPFIQVEQNLTRVLGSIDSWYDAIQWHDITDKVDSWKHHKVAKPFGNDLFELNETMGFWIHITQPGDTIFLYNGTQPSANQSIALHPGWNMVGYPSLSNRNRTTALNNIIFDQDVDAIWTFNAATQSWQEIGPGDYFELGRGYWIHSKVTKVWDVPL